MRAKLKGLARRARDITWVSAALRFPLRAAMRAGLDIPHRIYQHLPFRGVFRVEMSPFPVSFTMRSHGHAIENALYWQGIDGMEPECLIPFMHFARESTVVLDIGANTGVYSLVAAASSSGVVVHAFEPIARIAALARENVRLNPGSDITVHEVAVGAENGHANIFDPGGDNAYSASLNGAFLAGDKLTYLVPVTTIDAFVAEQRLARVDLVKLDVEGFEEFALTGMEETITRFSPSIFLEFLSDREGHRPLVARIESLLARGYVLYQLLPEGVVASTSIRAARKGAYNVLLAHESKLPATVKRANDGRP